MLVLQPIENVKPKPMAPFTRDFSNALSKLQVIARNSDWFIAMFAPVVIGRSNYFGIGFFDSHLKTALRKTILNILCGSPKDPGIPNNFPDICFTLDS